MNRFALWLGGPRVTPEEGPDGPFWADAHGDPAACAFLGYVEDDERGRQLPIMLSGAADYDHSQLYSAAVLPLEV